MLIRNIDKSKRLYNGTRFILVKFVNHVIEANIIIEKNNGDIIYISRMYVTSIKSLWIFKLTRRQISIIISYVITINKIQSQSLDYVGFIFFLRVWLAMVNYMSQYQE